jgi:hypothetical protein
MNRGNRTLGCATLGFHKQNYNKKSKELIPFFTRRPYMGTAAETKDLTQEKLHEFDYRKG